MTQMFDSFAEQRENPLKFETTAQSQHLTPSHPHTIYCCCVCSGTFERSTISEMKGKCEQIEM